MDKDEIEKFDGRRVGGRRRSRRQVIMGAGVLGVAAAAAVAKASPAAATDGQPLIVGDANTATAVTALTTLGARGLDVQTNTNVGINGVSSDASGNGIGVQGFANTTNGSGVSGSGFFGVYGTSGTGAGVFGQGEGNVTAVQGNAAGGTGVYGVSVGPSGGRVVGGVVGDSNTSIGVVGLTSAPTMAAGLFFHTADGTALNVQGKAEFSRSGSVYMAAGEASANVAGVALTSASLVFALVQNNTTVMVARAVPNVSASSFTIALNKAVPSGKTAVVAWFIVN